MEIMTKQQIEFKVNTLLEQRQESYRNHQKVLDEIDKDLLPLLETHHKMEQLENEQ